MNLDSLRLLAEHGLTSVRPDKLGALGEVCRLEAETSDRPALWVLGRTLRAVEDAWGEQGVPGPLADALDGALRHGVGAVLRAHGPAEEALQAIYLEIDVDRVLRDWSGWDRWYIDPQS